MMIIQNENKPAKFYPGETIYPRGTSIPFVVHRVKWFDAPDGTPAWSNYNNGWRYEFVGCLGLFMPEWHYSRKPT